MKFPSAIDAAHSADTLNDEGGLPDTDEVMRDLCRDGAEYGAAMRAIRQAISLGLVSVMQS